jgi:transposase-like protein
MEAIRTLQQAIQYFSDEQSCIDYMVKMRWPDGVVICPTCGRDDVSWLKNQRKWQCKSRHSKRQFSAKVGTIFEDSPLGLDKWLMTAWMLVNCKNGISSYEIARAIGVTQKSAWFMLHRLRLAMKSDHEGKLGGEGGTVEADECFVGGKERNKHLGQRKGEDKKTIVMGMKDRDTRQIRAKVIPNVKMSTLHNMIMENIGKGSNIYTDGWLGYQHLRSVKEFVHETVNHVDEYARARLHHQVDPRGRRRFR